MTLRARLSIALVVLMAIGLVAADVVTYSALHSYLIQRADQQVRSARLPAAFALGDASASGTPAETDRGSPTPCGTYVALFGPTGSLIRDRVVCYPLGQAAPLTLPASFTDQPVTVPGLAGGSPYRALASPLTDGSTLVVAIPLTEVDRTLSRLVRVALLVTLGVLLAMALISWFTVRRGLRPLEQIEETAGAIAGGDLSRRVDQADPRTEVGRLGVSLNAMLGRIEEAMDERRASEEALRRFLADASHELRTPLTSIRGYAELFRRGAEADPADSALAMRRIEQESRRMGALVEDLLFLGRSGQERPVAQEPVDLARVASDAVHDAQAIDLARPITLHTPAALTVVGDDARLRQILANLLSNALTHTPAGTPVSVDVRTEGDVALIEVKDRGSGLSPQAASHVFDPFYRADPARVRAGGGGEGTGLGLAIVAAIAEAHGGSVAVTSPTGEGATFRVLLPIEGQPLPWSSSSEIEFMQ